MATETDLLKGKRILIVDDEPDVLDALEELLSMCEVAKAGTYEEAVNLMDHRDFDMAVLDIMGVDGYKLLEKALKKDIIAVMLTAHALSVEDTVRSFKKGAAFYVPKDKMEDIAVYLNDILEAKVKGRSLWERWLDRFGSFYDKKFGPDWQKSDEEFWKKFKYWL
ncbi:MAG: response regulator [Desulfobacteraceae bacterium]